MKNLLTFCRALIFVGLGLTFYFLSSQGILSESIFDNSKNNNYLIAGLFLLIGFLMSFKKSLYRESGAVLGVGGIIVGFYHFTISAEAFISIAYSLLFLIPSVILWFSEKPKTMEKDPLK